MVLPLFSINLAAALVPGHAASAQSEHQRWLRACERRRVCSSGGDRGAEGGEPMQGSLTSLPTSDCSQNLIQMGLLQRAGPRPINHSRPLLWLLLLLMECTTEQMIAQRRTKNTA